LPDVVGLARRLGSEGLLGGVAPPAVDPGFYLEPVLPAAVGDAVEDVGVRTLDGVPAGLAELLGRHRQVLLVNWNPHCGYCARIAEPLARLHARLDAAGIDLVLVATGSADANRGVAAAAGLRATIVLLDEGADPFRDAGTPAAYHLGIDGLVASAPAYGCDEVPALAASLAGIELESGPEDEVRYLLERDGACAQGAAADGPQWAETRVYRLCDHHVGIRVDSEATGTVLDRLFSGQRVEDSRAGHSFSLAIPSLGPPTPGRDRRPATARGLNLLVQPGRPVLRSRDPGRILRALLWEIEYAAGAGAAPPGCIQVNAIAVVANGVASLIPFNFQAFAPRLQPLLARRGIALADVPRPVVDLVAAELVVSEPSVRHDATVISRLVTDLGSGSTERPAVLPGRYPLGAWCVIQPADRLVTQLTPAQAAAATVSLVLGPADAPARLQQLGGLFTGIAGKGLWYDSEAEVVEAVVRAIAGT
jgi:thiol-disulfide isomerase/thioredoxin